jgi:hypothetical protein
VAARSSLAGSFVFPGHFKNMAIITEEDIEAVERKVYGDYRPTTKSIFRSIIVYGVFFIASYLHYRTHGNWRGLGNTVLIVYLLIGTYMLATER